MIADSPEGAHETASFGFEDVPRAEKAQRVHGVFARVARRYDLMNDAMSGGLHRLWKDEAVAKLNPQPGEFFLDVAGGTGDIARRIAGRTERLRRRRGGAAARIAIVDINEGMLRAGRARGADALSWVCADAEKLPFSNAAADGYTIAFGIRNCTDIDAVLREARRTLRPGGRFVCLEFSRLAIGGLSPVYDFYSFRIIPLIGKAVAQDEESYRYLVESIRRFPEQEDFAGMMRAAGFARVNYRNLAGGVVALHWGWAL
ncbi:MAG: ubiquinone/menaquinone biosynthesis methyltransferase [Alphaproteobacteria bacterium]|nr:ubiquinone/menaquinone biosynthesis methyltransferase [Alphaproteobacteria bacterium]